jgi:hypothetical protein
VRALVEAAFADADRDVRTAAAYAVASRRDAALRPTLEAAAAAEKDTEAKHWLDKAVAIAAGGDLREFDPFTEKVLGDRRERQKWDMESLFGGGGRRGGEGGDRGDGDKKESPSAHPDASSRCRTRRARRRATGPVRNIAMYANPGAP